MARFTGLKNDMLKLMKTNIPMIDIVNNEMIA